MGYRFDPEALSKAAAGNRSAAASIDTGLAAEIPPVDAGASSELVGGAIAVLTAMGMTLAQAFEEIGKRVDASHGTYADVENSNAGLMTYVAHYNTNPEYDGPTEPLKTAPLRKTETEPDR